MFKSVVLVSSPLTQCRERSKLSRNVTFETSGMSDEPFFKHHSSHCKHGGEERERWADRHDLRSAYLPSDVHRPSSVGIVPSKSDSAKFNISVSR
jgi:hypothetical protein